MPRKGVTAALALGLALLGVAPARAVEASRLEQAREESGITAELPSRFDLLAGKLDVSSPERLAAAGQDLRFTVTLDRPVADGTLTLTLPSRWIARSESSDLPFAHVPAGGKGPGGGRGQVRRSQREVTLAFSGAAQGDSASYTVSDVGIPAGTYRVPFRWSEPGNGASDGVATVIFFAPSRDGAESSNPWARMAAPRIEENATNDSVTESETFLTAVPGNDQRFVVGANSNDGSGTFNAWVTNDGGATFAKAQMPATIVGPAGTVEHSDLCCDPMSAADAGGNLWYGGLSLDGSPANANPSRIVVNRIAPGQTTFQSTTVGLPFRTAGGQDKPMMTIDNSPGSPHFGRLYVVWDEPASGGVKVTMTSCDTQPTVTNCDSANHWSAPVSVTPTGGSYIYGDVAAGPAGDVYVTWWNYSSSNAIEGRVCPTNCTTDAAWSAAPLHTVATLDATGGTPVPFACPIMAQPGGRASPAPQVDVDRSGGPDDGRVYVTWGDLRTGSGTTRCAETSKGGTPPLLTHLTWDSFVASAAGGLPGSAAASPTVGTRLLTDGEGGGQSNSDEWFPWLAVDQTTGQAWADFYSTRDDSTRRTTSFYLRSVTPDTGDTHALGTLTKVSSAPSDYSTATCCTFGNDYGDYTGIDATAGSPMPVWSSTATSTDGTVDGEAYAFAYPSGTTPVDTVPPNTTIASGPADGSTTADNTPTFAFSASEAGATFACQLDGLGFSACTSPMTTGALADGRHVFAVRATDPSNNTDPSPATRSFTVDTTAPDTTIDSGPADGSQTTSTTSTFTFSSPETGAGFQCEVDGGAFAACNSPVTTPALGIGAHSFGVRAVDGVGNADQTPAVRGFSVVTTPPLGLLPARFGPGRSKTVRITRKGVGLLGRPRVTCPAATPSCTVTVTARAVLKGKRTSRIARTTRVVGSGRTARGRFVLTTAARRALVRRHRLRARLTLVARHGTAKVTRTLTVTLLPTR